MKRTQLVLAGLALALGAASVEAQTLYQLIDKNGKVTYSEKPPKDFPGQVIPLHIDPNANTATLPKPGTTVPPSQFARPDTSEQVKSARDRLDAARKAYQGAVDNPKDGEVTFMGNKGGGTRPVHSEAYTKRLADLERAVKEAEEDLKRAERG